MSRLLLRPISYRHVVFPDSDPGPRRAVNFTSSLDQSPPASEPPEQSLSSDEYDCLRWLFHRANLSADDYRCETLKRRIPACLRALRVSSLSDARLAIQRNPEFLTLALAALVIGVTGFFRDPPVFDALNKKVLPELLAHRTGPRMWCAGCSDGPELYSVAMLLAERGALQRASLLGTDCRPDSLARAREGRYDAASIRHVPPHFLTQYFRPEASAWRIHPYLRAIVQWRTGNVLSTPEPGAWDLILCRNMAIYFHPATAARLCQMFHNVLRPGGFLVLGKAERPHGIAGLRAVAPCIYRRDRS
jgi:chemotaxis methyl-accepting protein methylase